MPMSAGPSEQWQSMFLAADINNDGVVSAEEWSQLQSSMLHINDMSLVDVHETGADESNADGHGDDTGDGGDEHADGGDEHADGGDEHEGDHEEHHRQSNLKLDITLIVFECLILG